MDYSFFLTTRSRRSCSCWATGLVAEPHPGGLARCAGDGAPEELTRQAWAAARRSRRAARHTSQAAPAFSTPMARPTTMSGHPDAAASVTRPAARIARLAIASLRADSQAAFGRLPPEKAVAGQEECAGEIHDERSERRERQRGDLGRLRVQDLRDGRPDGRSRRNQDRHRQERADRAAGPERPAGGDEDEQVDARVLEEVDAVGEQRDRSDDPRDRELDAEVGEVEQGHQEDGRLQRAGGLRASLGRGGQRVPSGERLHSVE